ncbi:hypothetical protein ABEH22_13790 [Pantoea agglomerans]|nr:hypothetical protein [Pantoea agglomerans]WRO88851.1 hypothetical protein U9K49_11390 [Pantoea agglomerans]
MLATLIKLVMSIYHFFSSLPPETKEKIYSVVIEMFDSLFRQMFKNKTAGNAGEENHG